MSRTRRPPVELVAGALAERGEALDGEEALVDARELRADVEVHAGDLEAEAAGLARSTRARHRRQGRTSSSSCAVATAWCVSASTPGVSRTSTRRTPAAAARAGSSGASSTTVAPASAAASSSSSDLLFPWNRSRSPVRPRARREGELAECRDVGTEALVREHPQERDIRERLRPVHDERPGRGVAVGPSLRPDRLLAVDERGASRARLRAASHATPPSVSSPSATCAESGKSSSMRLLVSIVPMEELLT